MNKCRLLSMFPLWLLLCAVFPAAADQDKLFVNLTTDEARRVAMAVGFATKVREEKKIPVTIFLNVEGVRLADKNIAHCGASQELLKEFMRSGGRVIVCPMCMQNVGGMDKDDLISGVEIGGPEVTWPALFDDDVTVLSY